MYNSFTHCLFAASTKLYGQACSFKLHNSPISRLGIISSKKCLNKHSNIAFPSILCVYVIAWFAVVFGILWQPRRWHFTLANQISITNISHFSKKTIRFLHKCEITKIISHFSMEHLYRKLYSYNISCYE